MPWVDLVLSQESRICFALMFSLAMTIHSSTSLFWEVCLSKIPLDLRESFLLRKDRQLILNTQGGSGEEREIAWNSHSGSRILGSDPIPTSPSCVERFICHEFGSQGGRNPGNILQPLSECQENPWTGINMGINPCCVWAGERAHKIVLFHPWKLGHLCQIEGVRERWIPDSFI